MTPLEQVALIADIRVEVRVELDRCPIKLRDLLKLEPGSIIEMTRSVGENLEVFVGKAPVGFGEIVLIENSMGVRITDFRSEE